MSENIEPKKVTETLEKLVDFLRDSHKGFTDIGEHIKDETARLFFMKETGSRAQFAAELENELHHLGVKDVKQSGMISGAAHRTWGELKAKLGGGDHTLLATAEQGEDAAKAAYELALKEHLPGDVRQILVTQFDHIKTAHNTVKAMRDSKAT